MKNHWTNALYCNQKCLVEKLLSPQSIKRILIRMRIILVLLLLCTGSIFGTSEGQNLATVSLSIQNGTIQNALQQIEKQSGYSFVYNVNELDVNKSVNINLSNKSLASVLEVLFTDQSIGYKIAGKHIALYLLDENEINQQSRKRITGVVKDDNGDPIIGANVVEKGTTNGTITDLDGNFTLQVQAKSTLVFSYIGFQDKEIVVGDNTTYQVQLTEDTKALEEIVVVGYGTQKKANLTGSVASVSTEEMGKRQVGQTSLALQGLVPGVSITQRSGQPGADGGTISIRGKTTLGNNDALILVDGVEMGINNIDASLIESVSVLKDAASSAIYGSRAANGVILITTKRAEADKFSVSYSGYAGFQSAIDLPDMVGALDHMKMTNQAYTNIGKSPLYSDAYLQEYAENMSINPDRYPDTDWINETLTNNGLIQNHFVTLSGGSKRIRTSANIGYLDQNGIIENSNFKRYTFRMNTDMDISKQFSARIDAHVAMTKRTAPSRGDAFHWMSRIPAIQAGRLSTGQWGEGWNGDNPIAFTNDGGLQKVNSPSAVLNFSLDYKPTDWLTIHGNYSPNYYETHNTSFSKMVQTYKYDGTPYYRAPQKSSLTDETNRSLRNLLTASVTFDKTYGNHGLKVMLGYQQDDFRNDGHSGYRENFAFPDYPVLSAGGEDNQKAYGWASEWALQSLFGRINYDYKERYLFEANMRYDGSSKFADGQKWGIFPSFSAGWRISEEAFWEPLKNVVDNFKIRGSWGQLGNQNIGDNYPFSSDVDLNLKYVFNKSVTSGAGITSLANSLITWETTTVTDLGLDLTLLGKLNFTADYFYKVTDDILLKLNVPLTIGMSAPQQNAGKVENRGWDLGINYANSIGDFNYKLAFNLSDVKNKILDLKGINETGLTVSREGEEMFSLFGLEAEGYIVPEDYDANGKYLYATQYGNFGPGDIKYKDQLTIDTDGDGIADKADGVINTSDRVIIGGTIPRYTFGLSMYGDYKGVDLSLLFQGVGKANGYLYGQGIQTFVEGGSVQEQHKDNWREDNRNAKFPRLAFNETNNMQNSSFWMKNAAYVRLKNIQLGYTVPQKLANKAFISHLRFYISADNLLTLDNFWNGFDVEAPVGNGGYYPQMKTISLGLDVRF